jgi:hypothetical protein
MPTDDLPEDLAGWSFWPQFKIPNRILPAKILAERSPIFRCLKVKQLVILEMAV